MSKESEDKKYFKIYNQLWNNCIIKRQEADAFLASSRSRRANSGIEELGEGTIEQECKNIQPQNYHELLFYIFRL